MNTFKLSYPVFPNLFPRYTRVLKGTLPSAWEELTPRQFIAIASAPSITEEKLISLTTGIKPRVVKKLQPFEMYVLLEQLRFITSQKPSSHFVIKSVTCLTKRFYAPRPLLKGVTFGQFIFADSFFSNYMETGNVAELHNFAASLYLANGTRFSDNMPAANSKYMAKLDTRMLQAILVNYSLIRQWLADRYPLVFTEPQNKKAEKQKHDPLAWVKIMESIVGNDIINQEGYAKIPIHNMLRYLTQRIRENRKHTKT